MKETRKYILKFFEVMGTPCHCTLLAHALSQVVFDVTSNEDALNLHFEASDSQARHPHSTSAAYVSIP